MNPSASDLSEDPRVLEAARAYLADLEAGRTPDRAAYLTRYPDLAGALGEYLDGVELAHAAGMALRPSPPPAATDLPTEPLGDFKIIREIGRGGMGVVYEAVQLSLGRRVALKVLPFAAALDARQLQRFRTEAHAAAQLHHTNIVPVYAVGCERGTHFYAMQLIEGRPLDVVVRELREQLPAGSTIEGQAATTMPRPASTAGTSSRAGRGREVYRTAARLIAQIADALEYAHEAGVVHRDVKPANLLLDGKGNVWITDFGLAHVSDTGLTQTGDVFGTLRYMSPEQASGRKLAVDHRTDVYSLGATLYELLTLEPIFAGHDRQTLLHQILTEEPRRPRLVDRGVPVELETIVLKALAKAPEDRYATAGEMAADLRRYLNEQPILARRPSLYDRVRKWLRRHPAYLIAALLLLVCGVIGLAVSTALVTGSYHREKQRAIEADQRFQLARRVADEMVRIANEELADNPFQQGPRRRLLDAAFLYYQEFIDLRRDDPTAQAELQATRDQVKAILADLAIIQGAERHMLLSESSVQDDLKLTAAQRARLTPVFAEIRGPGPGPGFGPPPDGPKRGQKLLAEMKAHEAAIADILTATQFQRLGQVALQMRGVQALRDPDVAATLGLTRQQREQIRDLDGPFGPGGPGPGGPGPGGPGGPRRQNLERALALLTPEQATRWRELIGDPFTGRLSGPRPGGPGGPGGPGHQ
jgi:serine/threonine protein kinase